MVLQHAVGANTLTGYAAVAADVDKSGAINAMDAYYILQKSVDLISLPFPGAGVVWEFDPANREYVNLNSDQTGENFTAVLLGDVSGNWSPPALHSPLFSFAMRLLSFFPFRQSETATVDPVIVHVQDGTISANGRADSFVTVEPNGLDLYSLELIINYEITDTTLLTVTVEGLAEEWMISRNLTQPGEVRISIAGAQPITADGIVLQLHFQVEEGVQTTLIEPTWGEVNEAAAPVELISGTLSGNSIYLPMITR